LSARTLIDPAQLASLGSTRLRARSVVEGIINGMHRNPHRGSSVEFAEYKEYRPGDDVRHIDWRAWGRLDRYYVKQFEDETNVRAFMLVDASGSMNFGSRPEWTKYQHACTMAASLSWLLLAQGDAPGLLVFDERAGSWLPPSTRRTQLDDLCAVLDQNQAVGGTSIELAMSRIAESVRARSMVVLFSDLLDFHEEVFSVARILRRRGMEVVVFHVMDPAELELPYEGLSLFEGMENDGNLLVDPDDIRAAYQQAFAAHADQMRELCRAADMEYFRVRTDEPLAAPLRQLVEGRTRGGRR
jgi:uncharacterized protein (DUF58 family)